MHAELVYDNAYPTVVRLPEALGEPSDGQLRGTPGERLIEICGRTCYDSFGRGRDSAEYHKHIIEVGHGSVWEHYNITIEVEDRMEVLRALVNRPGCWVRFCATGIRITYNPRVVMDWDSIEGGGAYIRDTLANAMSEFVPAIVSPRPTAMAYTVVGATDDNSRWLSFYMTGSRGFSHEQVRHGDFTAISQRSTRYVDESVSEWVMHPLLRDYLADNPEASYEPGVSLGQSISDTISDCQDLYTNLVSLLHPWLVAGGLDGLSARKQARGAARGYLGNGLATSLMFSASVAQWKRMIMQRASPFADAEIREIYERCICPVLNRV